MKFLLSSLTLLLAPTLFAAPIQSTAPEPTPQTSIDTPRSPSGKATSHDRHMRKHRVGNHHHRRRTTAKNHNP
jgi:hypothetical protein